MGNLLQALETAPESEREEILACMRLSFIEGCLGRKSAKRPVQEIAENDVFEGLIRVSSLEDAVGSALEDVNEDEFDSIVRSVHHELLRASAQKIVEDLQSDDVYASLKRGVASAFGAIR